MIRVSIILTMLLLSFWSKAQNFILFDEEVFNESILLTPKGKTRPVLKGDQLYGFCYPYNVDIVKEKAPIFFRLFEPLTSSERDMVIKVHVEIIFTGELKMNYYTISIPKESRDFFLVREQKLVQWLDESYSDMSRDREEYHIVNPDKFVGGTVMVHVRGYYIHASDLLPESGSR